MNDQLSVDLVTAARQWYPQLLAYLYQASVGYAISFLDLLVGHQPREHLRRDVPEYVSLDHPVDWLALEGQAPAVGATALKWDLDRLIGGDIGRGGELRVGAQEGVEGWDTKHCLDVGQGGAVGGHVSHHTIAGGSFLAALESCYSRIRLLR